MRSNCDLYFHFIYQIASALGSLNEKSVFVGGAVVGCYINDPAAEEMRPTKDIDISMDILTAGELEKIRQELISRGFSQSHDDKVICRFRYNEMIVDIMSTKEVGWAPANKWFAPGFKYLEKYQIKNISINILSLAYFMASKFEAFESRGANDPRTCHDFEDIVYILNNRKDLTARILESTEDVKSFLKNKLKLIVENDSYREAILCHLVPSSQAERLNIILNRINDIINE